MSGKKRRFYVGAESCLHSISIFFATCFVCCLLASSASAALSLADLPAAGGVLQDKTIYMVRKKQH